LGTSGVGAGGLTAEVAGASSLTLGTIGLAAGGLWLGWEIGHASGLSDWFYGKASGGSDGQASSGTISAGNWTSYTCTTAVNDWQPCSGRYATGDKIWELVHVGGGCSGTARATSSWESAWNTDFSCNSSDNTQLLNWLNANENYVGAWKATGDCTGSGSTNDCVGIFIGTHEIFNYWNPTQGGTYNSTNNIGDRTLGFTGVPKANPPAYGSAAQIASETLIEEDDDVALEIGKILHPDQDFGTGGDTQTQTQALPQPRFGETATQYRTRLRAAGFLGTITLTEEDPYVPEIQAQHITRIETETQTVDLLDPWPNPPATINIPGEDDEITVFYNPEDAPEIDPGDPGGNENPPPGDAPPPGDSPIDVGSCSCPPPDFGPITDIDYGDHWPFVAFTEILSFLGGLDDTANAPVFDFDFTSFSAGDFGPYDLGNYEVDLSILDSYMTTIRFILGWVIWVGGLWWFASRWLGFHATGNVGAAADDADMI